MREEDVEAVRRGYEAWNRGEVGAVLELVDPDIEWRPGTDAPEAGEHRGRDGFRGFLESWPCSPPSKRPGQLRVGT